jgi:hypothetical protein
MMNSQVFHLVVAQTVVTEPVVAQPVVAQSVMVQPVMVQAVLQTALVKLMPLLKGLLDWISQMPKPIQQPETKPIQQPKKLIFQICVLKAHEEIKDDHHHHHHPLQRVFDL